ncbi:hypothetical protein Anas_14265 [Armadillidium nasatum]|uniref:Uncharacterized protein n=1 Tax=Armadillidium nasatum TaxID=96803 RepID=A0A5N5THJ6_9CRUS|nr:hypothetical protein Anas_14265 [Armadillidium nasatum]
MKNPRGNHVQASTSSSQNVHITSGNSNQHINVYCGSHQRQSFNNANSPHPKQSFGAKSKPPGMKTGSVYHHNFQPKNNQTENRSHSNTANYSRKPVAQVNKGPMASQSANQHINIHCTTRQQQSFHNANSSGSKPSGMVKSNPQGKKPGAIMNQNSKFQVIDLSSVIFFNYSFESIVKH